MTPPSGGTTAVGSLLDAFLPTYDAAERHSTDVHALPVRVYAAVRALDVRGSPLIRTLFFLRCIPGALANPRQAWAARRAGNPGLGLTLDGLLRSGFVLLGERPEREMVLGLVGQFWRPVGGIVRVPAEEWTAWERPGYAKAAWNFTLAPGPEGAVRLATETRVRCTDAESRRKFLRYWRLVGPFSGLIRREMLRGIRGAAER